MPALSDYETRLKALTGEALLNELEDVIRWQRVCPDDQFGRYRFEVAWELCSQTEEGRKRWEIARTRSKMQR